MGFLKFAIFRAILTIHCSVQQLHNQWTTICHFTTYFPQVSACTGPSTGRSLTRYWQIALKMCTCIISADESGGEGRGWGSRHKLPGREYVAYILTLANPQFLESGPQNVFSGVRRSSRLASAYP